MRYTIEQLREMILPMVESLGARPPAELADALVELISQDREAFMKDAPGETSDGYHTFRDLYDHRMALTKALMESNTAISWKSKNHHPDGDPMFDGFFIVGMDLPAGQISYHYKLEHWDVFKYINEWHHAPLWDGHSPEDVVKRLLQWRHEADEPTE